MAATIGNRVYPLLAGNGGSLSPREVSMNVTSNFEGRVALVTGGNSGMDLATPGIFACRLSRFTVSD